jgi:hypothetical protein
MNKSVDKSRRKFLIVVTNVTIGVGLVACTSIVETLESEKTNTLPESSVTVKVEIKTTPTPTATREPLPTPTPEIPPLIAHAPDALYPYSDADFVLHTGGEKDTKEKLLTLSGETDSPTRVQLEADLAWIEQTNTDQLVAQGLDPADFGLDYKINQTDAGFFWTAMLHKKGGSYYLPKITSGTDAGQLIRKGDLTLLIGSDISFELIPIVEAGEGTEQRIIADESGWFVVGAFDSKGSPMGWFNVEKDSWQPLSSFKAQGAQETVFNSDNGVWEGKDTEGKTIAVYDIVKGEWTTGKDQLTQILEGQLFYDPEQLAGISDIQTSESIDINGVMYSGIVGTRDGQEVILGIGVKTEYGEGLTRVSEYADTKGHKSFVFINPKWILDGAVQVNQKTAGIIDKWLYQGLSEGQFASLGNAEAVKEALWNMDENKDGIIDTVPLQIPRCASPTGNDSNVVWGEADPHWNLELPIELILAGSQEEYEALPDRLRTGILDRVVNGDYGEGSVGGPFFTTGLEDGHGIIVVVLPSFRENHPFSFKVSSDINEKYNITMDRVRKSSSSSYGGCILELFRVFAYIKKDYNALSYANMEDLVSNQDTNIMFDCLSNSFWKLHP